MFMRDYRTCFLAGLKASNPKITEEESEKAWSDWCCDESSNEEMLIAGSLIIQVFWRKEGTPPQSTHLGFFADENLGAFLLNRIYQRYESLEELRRERIQKLKSINTPKSIVDREHDLLRNHRDARRLIETLCPEYIECIVDEDEKGWTEDP